MHTVSAIRVGFITACRYAIGALVLASVSTPATVGAQSDEKRPANALGVGVPKYDLKKLGVVIPFAFLADACKNRTKTPLVEFQVLDSTWTMIAIPVLISGDSAAAAQHSRLDGIPLKCGAYVAFWSDSSDTLRRSPDSRYRFILLVDGKRNTGFVGPVKY
jgi:hypothetical protein